MECGLEIVVLPVSDVDKARDCCQEVRNAQTGAGP